MGTVSATAYQDGRFLDAATAGVSPLDEGLRSGFSLYETVLLRRGSKPFRLDAHLARLARSAAHFGLGAVPAAGEVLEAARRIADADGIATGRLRVTVAARGEGGASTFWVTVRPFVEPTAEDRARGLAGHLAPFVRCLSAPSSGHKTGNFLDALLFRRSLPPGSEGVVLNDAGRLAEGCFTNLFLVRGGALGTPPLGEGCLPGITRDTVLAMARAEGIHATEEPLALGALETADEAFATNALGGVLALVSFEGRPIGAGRPGPLTAHLQAALAARMEAAGTGRGREDRGEPR